MEKRKKILFVITKSDWGGAQQYVFDLATKINPEKYDPIVAVGGDGLLVDKLQAAGLRVLPISGLSRDISPLRDLQSIISLAKIYLKEKPDVVHLNSTKAGSIGALLARLFLIDKVIFTAHGWAFNEDRPQWQKLIIKAIHWLTVVCSDVTIAVSNGTKAQMDAPFTKDKTCVVHLGRTPGEIKPKDDARGILEMRVIDNDFSLSEFHDDFWLGTIAELHPIKRLNRAIDAVAALTREIPNIRFVIIHDGQLKAQLEQQVRDLGLQKHVFFTGTIENASRLLAAFDAFVLPSKSEAFGYVLIEAGLAGVPIVATNVGGIPDIITDNENGLLVEPDNTPALTLALKRLIENEGLRGELADANLVKASSFTLEKMLAETEAIYDN